MAEKFIRRPDFASGELTPEERTAMDAHAQLWIARAMRTDPIDRAKIEPAILGLYAAAKLKAPRVVVVTSPLVMAMAGGFAAAFWHRHKTWDATEAATEAATGDATRAATEAATRDATWAATEAATGNATEAATWDATRAATRDATWAATEAATWAATEAATGNADFYSLALAISGDVQMARFMLSCASNWSNCYQGGNMWARYDAYLTAARDILGLRLPSHEAYSHWEQATIHGGFRWMHEEFCMVCDFPEVLLKDEQNRPHCDDGPSHRWRDGWSLYHVHGVRVPAYVIEHPEEITVALIDRETNAEVRRVMVEKYGQNRYLLDSGATAISRDRFGLLYRKDMPDDEPIVMVRVLNSTPEPDGVMSRDEAIAAFGPAAWAAVDAVPGTRFKEYMIRVHPELRPLPPGAWSQEEKRAWIAKQKPQSLTAHNAVASTFGLRGDEYHPDAES